MRTGGSQRNFAHKVPTRAAKATSFLSSPPSWVVLSLLSLQKGPLTTSHSQSLAGSEKPVSCFVFVFLAFLSWYQTLIILQQFRVSFCPVLCVVQLCVDGGSPTWRQPQQAVSALQLRQMTSLPLGPGLFCSRQGYFGSVSRECLASCLLLLPAHSCSTVQVPKRSSGLPFLKKVGMDSGSWATCPTDTNGHK